MLGSNTGRGKRLLSFYKTSRTDAEATQPPTQPVLAVLSRGKLDSLHFHPEPMLRTTVALLLCCGRGTLDSFSVYCLEHFTVLVPAVWINIQVYGDVFKDSRS